MEKLRVPRNFERILLRLLPSPEIKLASQQLRISNHLDMIRDSLWVINAVKPHFILRAVKEPKLNKWLGDFSTVMVDVQNILEVIQDNYQQPREQQKQKVTASPNSLLSSRRHALLVELKQIAQSLNCLLSRMNAFELHNYEIDSMDPNQDDYYSILQQEVVGRDDDVNRILQIIFGLQQGIPSRDINYDVPFVVAITGKELVGKSTLARMVYHHPLVREFFKHRIWVDVSNSVILSFNHKQVARECIKHLTGRILSDVDIWNILHNSLPQTKFLLVLDGFYNITMENRDKWEELRKNLLSFGGRVIITCRSYPVTENDQMAYLDKEYKIKNISQDAWNKLFLRYAIPTTQLDQTKQISPSIRMADLLNKAKELYAMELYQLPVQAIFQGLILRHTPFDDFQKQLDNTRVFGNITNELTQIIFYIILFKPLPLSFICGCFDMLITEDTFNYSTKSEQEFQQNLLTVITQFPEVEPSDTRVPVYLRMMYHFKKRNGQEFKIPQQCRYLLLHTDSNTRTYLTNLRPKISNNLRMLMLYKEKEEMDLQLTRYQETLSIEIPKSLSKNLIILSIIDTGIKQLPNTISMFCRLRYLNLSEKDMEELPKSICDLYNLRVLSLSHSKRLLRLPEKMFKLTKLQILRLAYCTRLQKLPKSITGLVNLQVLDIEACYWLKELPEELGHLETLMNLHMLGCASLTRIPIRISKLTNLEALSGYIVDDSDHGSLTLQELQSLTSMEQLHIHHLECVLDLNAITSVDLKEKRYLENLLLHWEWWNMDARKNDQLQSFKILDGLQPNFSHLKSLEIISYLDMNFPNWMMMDEQLLLFKSLVEIRLVNLKRCENLPLLGRLHSLAHLEISGMDSITCVGSTISNDKHTFPKLVKLILSEMATLVQWNLRCPYLEQLTLAHCPKLISLRGFTLKNKLTIWLESELLGQYSSHFRSIFKNIKELEIVGCQEIRQLSKNIKKCKKLQTLSIIRCSKLLSVPNWLQQMPSLQQICLAGCTTISYIPKKLKRRLKGHIIVQGCSKLKL